MMEEASWRRHQGGGIMKEASWRRHHGGGRGGCIMEEASGGGIMEEASWRKLGFGILVVASRLGIMALESWLRNHGCGNLALEPLSWNPGFGILVVEPWL